MRFLDYIGRDQLVADLKKAIAQRRVGHAYLLVGPRGSGRRTLAHLFAQALLCMVPSDQPCDCCRACTLVKAGSHPDLQAIQADGATIRIEQMRSVRATIALKPLLGRHRVCLLAEMERMSEAAANSFLLTLEEPPPGVVFIGWATTGQPLLPTVVSRCQVLKLQPLTAFTLTEALVARGFESGAAGIAAERAEGLPGLALRLLAGRTDQAEDADELAAGLFQADLPTLLRTVETISKLDREEIERRLAALNQLLRSVITARVQGGDASPPDVAGLPCAAIWRLHRRVTQAEEYLRVNANARLLLDVLALSFYQERACSGPEQWGGLDRA